LNNNDNKNNLNINNDKFDSDALDLLNSSLSFTSSHSSSISSSSSFSSSSSSKKNNKKTIPTTYKRKQGPNKEIDLKSASGKEIKRNTGMEIKKLWTTAIVSDKSQYSFGATGSCTIMSLEAAYYLQKKVPLTKEIIYQILDIGALYTAELHTSAHEILPRVTRYSIFEIIKELQESSKLMDVFIQRLLKQGSTHPMQSVIVTKPPESVLLHLTWNSPTDYEFVLFDSHTRHEFHLSGAHFLVFNNEKLITNYLKTLFVPLETDAFATETEIYYNLMDTTVFALKPGDHPDPMTVDRQRLQSELEGIMNTKRENEKKDKERQIKRAAEEKAAKEQKLLNQKEEDMKKKKLEIQELESQYQIVLEQLTQTRTDCRISQLQHKIVSENAIQTLHPENIPWQYIEESFQKPSSLSPPPRDTQEWKKVNKKNVLARGQI